MSERFLQSVTPCKDGHQLVPITVDGNFIFNAEARQPRETGLKASVAYPREEKADCGRSG